MPTRFSALGTCALLLVALPFVWGCDQPARRSAPTGLTSDSIATETGSDSALVDSMAAVLDRFSALRSPEAAHRTALRRWARVGKATADSLKRTDPVRARELYRRALQAYRQIGDSARVADGLRELGQIYEHESKHDAALASYRSALTASRAAGDRTQTADLLHDVGTLHEQQNRYDAALRHYQEALSLFRDRNHQPGIARALGDIGNVHQIKGNYDEAQSHLREALAISRERGQQRVVAETLNDVGIVHYRQGEYGKALGRFRKALSIYRELGDPRSVAEALNRVGAAYNIQGRYGDALSHYQQALSVNRDREDADGIARNLNNIAIAHRHQGRYDEAETSFRQALSLNRELGDRRDEALNLSNLGEVLRLQGRHEEALAHFREALSINRDLGARESIASNLNNIGKVYERRSQPSTALRRYREALALRQRLDSHRQPSSLKRIGDVLLARGQVQAATDTLNRAVRLAEELRLNVASPDARRSLLSTQVDAYRALTTAYVRARQPDAALRSLERARARLLADRLAGTARGDTTFVVRPAAELRRALGSDEVALLYTNAGSERPLTALVATRDTTYARELPEATVRAAVGRAYPDRLRRLRQDDGPLAAVLGAEGARETDGPPSLAATIRLYRSFLTREEARDSLQHALGQRLHDLLVAPVAEQLRPPKTVTVVPTGVLGYLPFEALRGPSGQYLIQRTHLRYAQSLTVLRQLQRRTYARAERPLLAVGGAEYGGATPDTEGLLLAAVRGDSAARTGEQAASLFRSAERRMERGQSPRPTYDQLGYGQWSPLPGTVLEVQKLRGAVGPGTTLLTGPAASEERVREMSTAGELARYRRLHFATHGVAVPEAPQLSALVLSQVGASDSLAARDLTMREIADLQLRADVAVLSACRTGLGRLVEGEGIVNLSHAFLRAGANATLVSQWRVLDWSTQQFMTAVHRRAQADTTSFAEAVTQVKRAFIDGRFGARNTDPLRWAPFVYYGRE